MSPELIVFLVMAGVFLAGCFLCKLPVSLSMVLAAVGGTLAAGLGVPLHHLVEGMFAYLDTVLVIATAMLFMKVVERSGALDAVTAAIIRRFHRFPALMLSLIMLIIMFPGMMTGSSTAAVLSAGTIMAPVLLKMGVPRLETASILAMGGLLGMIAPPTNIPVMLLNAGVDIPYSGFTLPLALLTFPLAFLFVLLLGYRHVKQMDFQAVEPLLNDEAREKFGFRIYLPILTALVLMLLNKVVPGLPDLGMPLVFLLSSLVGLFTGRRFDPVAAARESIHSVLPVMGILMGVGMVIQVMTLTGVRGLVVTACLSLPEAARYLALSVSMPLFGALSSFGSASVLGVPFLLSFLGKNEIIVSAALSLVAALGDMMPPTALAGIFAAQALGMNRYTPVLKKCLPLCLIMVLWAVLFLVGANFLAPLTAFG